MEQGSHRPLVALVVDDDEAVRNLVREVLERRGFKVITAPDGKTAALIYAHQPELSLIVTDILMPVGDGIGLILKVRGSAGAGGAKPKILAISGGGAIPSEVYLQDAEGLGADLTLAKPFAAFELIEALSRLGFDQPWSESA